jgi:hypothetical protein
MNYYYDYVEEEKLQLLLIILYLSLKWLIQPIHSYKNDPIHYHIFSKTNLFRINTIHPTLVESKNVENNNYRDLERHKC